MEGVFPFDRGEKRGVLVESLQVNGENLPLVGREKEIQRISEILSKDSPKTIVALSDGGTVFRLFQAQIFSRLFQAHFNKSTNITKMNRRLEIVGLNYKNNGRSCSKHIEACGREAKVGRIYVLQKKQLNIEYEEFIGPRTELQLISD